MREVHFVIASWIREQGLELDGADFCIYHVGPATGKDPKDDITQVCVSVRYVRKTSAL